MTDRIVFTQVSKFYGEVLGVNRIELSIGPGLTGLVGPNGSGKSTLMNLMTGLLQPDRGEINVLGVDRTDPESLFRMVGYCTQWDSFPHGASGLSFLTDTLRLHGHAKNEARAMADEALAVVGLTDAARRRIAGYSKGMKQRVKLAHAICHSPRVLVLDEPLNGLDPVGRTDMINLLRARADAGQHVVVSSHILNEVDLISDTVVMIHGGQIVAEGAIREVREEIVEHPVQFLVCCDRPARVAARSFELDHVVGAQLVQDRPGVVVATRNGEAFLRHLTRIVLDEELVVECVMPADESVGAVYDYLIGPEGQTS